MPKAHSQPAITPMPHAVQGASATTQPAPPAPASDDTPGLAIFGMLLLGVIVAVVVLSAKKAYSAPSGPTHVCTNCRSQIRPWSDKPGSGLLELCMWLCFLVPGFLYTIWRLSSQRIISCPVCKSRNPVPLNTPAGRTLTA